MQFLDEAKIYVKSGNGGNGCLSFRREANVPKGGPDGGNGGRGGHIILRCVHGLNTLIDYRFQQHFKAKSGQDGMGRDRSGAYGKDLYLDLPVGTQIFMEDGETLLADLTKIGEEVILLRGGQGGLGNANFKSSVNRAPRKTTPGERGDEMWIRLRLKLLSDVGLIGLPNAGKSTFLSRVSRARPKIADYPFTTLKPQLGVVYIDGYEFVAADLPGLIEGAHTGHGLGDRFLRHIERCKILLHIIDGTEPDIVKNYKLIRNELAQYKINLTKKTEHVALNKIDAISEEELDKKLNDLKSLENIESVSAISASSGKGIEDVLRKLRKSLENEQGESNQSDNDDNVSLNS